ncbi:GAF domain-containing protein [Myxococcus sp. K15C18031901]|uniref:sensor histidine kinase n=1 Tax=Myxococcus dinghuensis TaxID=2906761 RepID=UPI0020A7BC6B|nr:GAF domain-containing protein [Myxococcus dinghuensis]MCP3099059.1 GAF domain-containing protein [Myxococcus dinghuensis]
MAASRVGDARQFGGQAPEVEERLALLAEASRVLADASLEPPAVMDRLCALVVPLLGAACTLRLLSEDGLWLRTVASAASTPEARLLFQTLSPTALRADEGPSAEVLRTGEALRVLDADPQELRSMVPPQQQGLLDHFPFTRLMLLPLRARGHSLGTLTVWRDTAAPPLESGEQLLLQELADRAALALDVARAYAAEKKARQAAEVAAGRLSRLQKVTAELSQVLTAERVAEVIVDQGLRAVGARRGALWVVEGQHARMLRCSGYDDSLGFIDTFGLMTLDGTGPMTAAILEARPIWVESLEAMAERYPEEATRRAGVMRTPSPSVAALPLMAEGRALGVLLFAFPEQRDFDSDEQAFLELLAHHAGQAVGRARLLEQEQAARAELAEANKRLAAIIQASPASILLVDMEGRVRMWNPAAERMFGWKAEEVLGEVLPVVPDGKHAEFRRNLEKAARGESLGGAVMQRQRKDGSFIQVALWTALVHPAGGSEQVLSMAVDVTERQRSEAAQHFLAEAGGVLATSLDQEETLERVAHLAVPTYAQSCGVFLADDSGEARCVAAAHEGEGSLDALPAPGAVVVARVVASGVPELRTGVGFGAPGSARPPPGRPGCGAWMCVPLQVRGQTLGALTFVTSKRDYDAQDLGLAQELARRSALAIDNARLYREARQAIRLREEFLSIASHELKTPISALQLQVQSLAALARAPAGVPAERLGRALEVVDRQVKRQTQLIHDLLDVSRISAGRLELSPEPLDLEMLVREVVERFEPELERTSTRLELVLAPDVHGRWDKLRLDQVLTNLVSNAVKYGRGNPVCVVLEAHPGGVRVEVKDGGIGIAEEHLPRLFHRFERAVSERNYGGFGLGLWITRQIVEAMGGNITVHSVLGVGSTFTVELPRPA